MKLSTRNTVTLQTIFVFLKRNIKKLSKRGRLPFSTKGVLVFDDEYIWDITTDSETKTKYCLLEKIATTENAIYIYISSIQAVILPNSVFLTEDERQRTLHFINSKVGILHHIK